ncbi:GNAT family N-acetyltransferase [Phenylobacterium sp.]|uniref:GNAT family N-acetyltransferase n=1 Tax=Phenylobacterium sp. TaxID=1871053 RepID=UPI0028970F56|nr:GNAT family N-acetyltransferase [Phenylobacterium sp.]
MRKPDHPIRLPGRLTDGVVVLDGHRVADAEAHLAGEDEEMLRRFDAPHASTLEQTRAAIQRWIDARSAGGPMIAYAMRRPSGLLLGGCELRPVAADRIDVSYWTFPSFRGRGYAGRALALLCEAAATLDGVRRIEAHIDADNLASRRVAERAGFVERGLVTDEAWSGETSTRVLYTRALGAGRARTLSAGT